MKGFLAGFRDTVKGFFGFGVSLASLLILGEQYGLSETDSFRRILPTSSSTRILLLTSSGGERDQSQGLLESYPEETMDDHRLLSNRGNYDSHWDIHNEAHLQGHHYHPDQ